MTNDELDERIRRAAHSLRREAPMHAKLDLLRRLRLQRKPTFLQRLGIAWERSGNDWRQSAYGFAFAALLALAVGVGLTFDPNASDVPEIDDIEFSGGSAVVIETHAEHTTLIWLSEVDEESLQDDEPELLQEDETMVDEENEEQGI